MSYENKSDSDLLISRVVDGEASQADWNAFRAMAEREPSLWRDLAECQRDHVDLSACVHAAIRVADGVEAPVQEELGRRLSERTRVLATWGGWAAAAAVALVWATGMNLRPAPSVMNTGSLVDLSKVQPESVINQFVEQGRLTPQDLYREYLDRGQERGTVVAEVPDRVLVTARPMKAGGGYEVIYIRQIMERARVKELSKVGYDEFGNPIPVHYEPPVPGSPARY
jgi:anti-sigma factor RsiW